MNLKNVKPGDVLFFTGEDLTIMVTMVGDNGIRYYEPMNPEFDNNGNLLMTYTTYASLSEWTISLGSITNISATLMGKK